MRPLAVTAAEGLDARGRRLAQAEEVEGACASQSGEGLLNKVIDDVDFVPGASTSSCSNSRVAAALVVACVLFVYLRA